MQVNSKEVRKSKEWGQADMMFSQISVSTGFSIVGDVPTLTQPPEEVDRVLAELLDHCPRYFKAWFHRGQYCLRSGHREEGERHLDRAFDSLVETVLDEDEFMRVSNQWVHDLEQQLRHDLVVKYLEKAIRVFPEQAPLYDDLAFHMLQLPERDLHKILNYQQKAMELEPGDEFHTNNMGWIYLVTDDPKRALEYFQPALELDVNSEMILENLDICETMLDRKLTYLDFLMRPLDREEVEKQEQYGDPGEMLELYKGYNKDRIEAFKLYHLKEGKISTNELLDHLQALHLFLQPSEAMLDGDYYTLDDAQWLIDNKKKQVLCFLDTSDYTDEDELDQILDALAAFAKFLEHKKAITRSQQETLVREYKALFQQVGPRLDTYLEERHDVTLNPEEQGQVIARLFQ